jgi:hypothetical protein
MGSDRSEEEIRQALFLFSKRLFHSGVQERTAPGWAENDSPLGTLEGKPYSEISWHQTFVACKGQ